jgi:hypothetical protein
VLVPFHELYAVRRREGRSIGLPQLSYSAFVSSARNRATGAVGHVHWFTGTNALFDQGFGRGREPVTRHPSQGIGEFVGGADSLKNRLFDRS